MEVTVKLTLVMDDDFIDEWITNNQWFGKGQEIKYAKSYVDTAIDNYICEHGTTGISYKDVIIVGGKQ